jgi:hypothetical protein
MPELAAAAVVPAWTAAVSAGAGVLMLVIASALVATRRRPGSHAADDVLADVAEDATEDTPLVGAACKPRARSPGLPPLLLGAGALLLCAGLYGLSRTGEPPARPAAPVCMTSDEQLLSAYEVAGVGGLGHPGTAQWPVRTSSVTAQRLFDQGANLVM